jgi:DHA1 family bicyclomycin/chloramphenicol resistance-like MFS transporter
MIFWFLVLFSVVLLFATWFGLPETHPPSMRRALHPRRLLSDYVDIFLNPRFQRLAAAGAFNFGALFLYIASAPAFVINILHLNQRSFGWFFVPMISGMMLGAFVSGRTAGRMSGRRQSMLGFACCGIAVTANVLYNLLVPSPSLPWAVLPMTLNAFGIALVFPILTLAILDMYPRQRGAASSLQAFTSLVSNAIVAGVLSPWLSGVPLHLALGTAVFAFLGWAFWRWEIHVGHRIPDAPRSTLPAIEPTDEM